MQGNFNIALVLDEYKKLLQDATEELAILRAYTKQLENELENIKTANKSNE